VPKTIDNDLEATDYSFGFDTAVGIATEAIDRLHTTAEAHNRVIVCEVMGRDAGWIALASGVAGGAHVILPPELPIDLDHVCRLLEWNHQRGKKYGIVVVAEGAKLPGGEQATKGAKVDAFGHARLSGIAEVLADRIAPGHVWRPKGNQPTPDVPSPAEVDELRDPADRVAAG
jgi:6-phosphofructokinase 1